MVKERAYGVAHISRVIVGVFLIRWRMCLVSKAKISFLPACSINAHTLACGNTENLPLHAHPTPANTSHTVVPWRRLW